MEDLPWNSTWTMKTPWRLDGIPSGILHGNTMEHDGSPYRLSFNIFLPTWNYHRKRFPWKYQGVFHMEYHGVSVDFFMF